MTRVKLHSNGNYWQAKWTASTGQPRRRSLGSKAKVSKSQAEDECRQIEAEMIVDPGMADRGKAPTLESWCKSYLAARTDIAPTTRRLHEHTITLLKSHFGKDARIDQITRFHAQEWAAKLEGKEATRRKQIRIARTIFGARYGALGVDLIRINPFDRLVGTSPKMSKKWHYVDAVDALEAILKACPDDHWRALIALCRLAGLRRGEALRLTWEDVDLGERKLTVRHEGKNTTKKKTRVTPIVPKLATILEKIKQPSGLVVGFSDNNLIRNFRVILKRAKVKDYAKPFQTLRRSRATDWQAEYPIMDMCDWLGHDPAVAREYYHQTRPETFDRATGKG